MRQHDDSYVACVLNKTSLRPGMLVQFCQKALSGHAPALFRNVDDLGMIKVMDGHVEAPAGVFLYIRDVPVDRHLVTRSDVFDVQHVVLFGDETFYVFAGCLKPLAS